MTGRKTLWYFAHKPRAERQYSLSDVVVGQVFSQRAVGVSISASCCSSSFAAAVVLPAAVWSSELKMPW